MSPRALKPLVTAIGLIPFALLVVNGFRGRLTANPIDYITDETGTYALALLIVTLGVTPVRRLTGWNGVIKVRKTLGLLSFFYATLHVLTWSVVDQFFDVQAMVEDVIKRPFITAGMTTYLLLIPLAITSRTSMIRRLGKRWQQLHRLTYVAAIGAVVHFWWLVKADIGEPRIWAVILAVLLGLRAWWAFRNLSNTRA